MFHLLAFGSAALDASAGDVQLPAIADQVYSRSNNNFQIPVNHWLYWAYAGSPTMSRARINTASLLGKGLPQIFPVNTALQPVSPYGVRDMRDNPIPLRAEEDFRVDITNGAAEQAGVFAAVSPMQLTRNINVRDTRLVRFTATSTLVADGWAAPVAIAFQDVLEAGVYHVYGMYCTAAADLVAARLIFPNNQQLRPGCMCSLLPSNYTDFNLFIGGMGKWGEFTTYALPQIECYGDTAGAETVNGLMLIGKN